MTILPAIAAARAALAAALFTDTFATERGTSGPCGVKNDSGDGTPITIHCAADADILPSDTVYINGRTYMVIDSHNIHGMSLARHFTLVETARTAPVVVGSFFLLESGDGLLLESGDHLILEA